MKHIITISLRLLALVSLFMAFGCTEEMLTEVDYGYAQFQLLHPMTKGGEQLEQLREAAKIKINLLSAEGKKLSQTLNLVAGDEQTANMGLQSDKWMLLAGCYTVTDYALYDGLDELLLTITYPDKKGPSFNIVGKGLELTKLYVDALTTGQVKFRLVKRNAEEIPVTKGGSGIDKYPFFNIQWADITVRNIENRDETTIEKLKMTYHTIYEDKGDVDGDGDKEDDFYYSGVCTSDSLVTLPTGKYEVIAFTTYFDSAHSSKLAEYCNDVADNEFEVSCYHRTSADVPVTLNQAADYIRDAYALKEIWEALDGPNWYYKGKDYPEGTNWKFDNCDVDLWLAQPGISVLSNGRVATLSLTGFGAKGDMPESLGQLTELRSLVMGTHTFNTSSGSNTLSLKGVKDTKGRLVVTEDEAEAYGKRIFDSFNDVYGVHKHPLESFSEPMQQSFEKLGLPQVDGRPSSIEPFKKSTRQDILPPEYFDAKTGYATQIKSLPEVFDKFTKMTGFFYAFGPIEKIPETLAKCTEIRDIQIMGCPNLTEFPIGVAQNPNASGLHFASNSNITAEKMLEGLQLLNSESPKLNGGKGSKLSILQMPGQKCKYLPDMTNLKNLGMLDIRGCDMEYIEKAFGKDHYFSTIWAQNNKFKTLPVDEDGYFVALHGDFEELNMSYNEFEKLPNIFKGNSVYILKTIDFSFNKINGFDESREPWKGINVEIFNLAYNQFDYFPKFYTDGDDCSQISYLIMQGNKISSFEEEAFEGKYNYWTTALDLSLNNITELPRSFNGSNLPFLTGLDLSNNNYANFEYKPLNIRGLTTYVFNDQHDRDGNRSMREWPANVWMHSGLRTLYLKGNDIRKVPDGMISNVIYLLDIRDNPNITIDMSSVCYYISAGAYLLFYDPEQDIRGCDILDLK